MLALQAIATIQSTQEVAMSNVSLASATDSRVKPSHSDVRVWDFDSTRHTSKHERAAHAYFAQELGKLKGLSFRGAYGEDDTGHDSYFLPNSTVIRRSATGGNATGSARVDATGRARLNDVHDLFGGVVPFAFVATKAISHRLHSLDDDRPDGWNESMGNWIAPMTLRGYTAFSIEQAMKAGRQLLQCGAVRVKAAGACGGKGQWVVNDCAQLRACLAELDTEGCISEGVVLEENLEQCTTLSVGQVVVAGHVVSYHGTQYTTRDNAGGSAYGGSDLVAVRGDFASLLSTELTPSQRLGVQQAQRFHDCVQRAYPDFFASRINYDVVQGVASDGAWKSGVLEQSWRIGGATSAEVAALRAFNLDPERRVARVSSGERYGRADIPGGADVYFCGDDPQAGLITRYSLLH
jgi:hypothetical protein